MTTSKDAWKKFEEEVLSLPKYGSGVVVSFTFDTVSAYIDGYCQAIWASGWGNPIDGFREWLCCRFQRGSSLCYHRYILLVCENNEEKALKAFFSLFNEFVECRREKGLEHILEEDRKRVEREKAKIRAGFSGGPVTPST